jgi:hypothetical protein
VQQSADVASSQRAALEAQLREAQEKAQQAQQKADAATGQQRTIETRLKEAQQKVQQIQQNADVAIGQQRMLETQLKEAQQKAQQVQQSADVAISQRAALQAQLREAQERAQLVKQDADRASSQRSALESQLKKAQENTKIAQQSADLAANQRSALETELKKAKDEVQIAQQNAEVAINQRAALELQLKNEHVKLQQMQANADQAADRQIELEAQLSQELERIQKAKANADSATSELRGIRLRQKSVERSTSPLKPTTRDRNSESSISTGPSFAWFVMGVNPAEKQYGQTWAKYIQLKPPQHVSMAPSPSTQEAGTSNPPEPQRNIETDREEEFLKEFVIGYLRTVASNDLSLQRPYFAQRVNFYGRGVLNSSNIETSTQRYHDEWPVREWTPSGGARVVRSRNPKLFTVYQPFNWSVSDGSHNANGDATLYLRIRKNSQGEFQIVHIRQLDR